MFSYRNEEYDFLKDLSNVWNGTEDKIDELLSLKYTNEEEDFIIHVDDKPIIMEVMSMLVKEEYNYVIEFLRNAVDRNYVLWDQDAMDEAKNKVSRELAVNKLPEVGIKGIDKCRYCSSTELVFSTKQTRSGDEPMTIFVRCVMCQKQWRQ